MDPRGPKSERIRLGEMRGLSSNLTKNRFVLVWSDEWPNRLCWTLGFE